MNGVVEIKINEAIHTLRFGYTACQEFEVLMFKNATANAGKVLTDLIYAALFGEAMRLGKAAPEYTEASDLMENLAQEDNFDEQALKIWATYHESKWGKDFQKRIDLITSKKKENEQPSQ